MDTKPTGFSRLVRAFFYSLSGLRHAFASEAAFRLECFFFLFLCPIALLIDVEKAERVALVGSLFLVLIVELINSALETTINRISTEIHPLSKQVKDMGSASVFIALMNVLITWAIILF